MKEKSGCPRPKLPAGVASPLSRPIEISAEAYALLRDVPLPSAFREAVSGEMSGRARAASLCEYCECIGEDGKQFEGCRDTGCSDAGGLCREGWKRCSCRVATASPGISMRSNDLKNTPSVSLMSYLTDWRFDLSGASLTPGLGEIAGSPLTRLVSSSFPALFTMGEGAQASKQNTRERDSGFDWVSSKHGQPLPGDLKVTEYYCEGTKICIAAGIQILPRTNEKEDSCSARIIVFIINCKTQKPFDTLINRVVACDDVEAGGSGVTHTRMAERSCGAQDFYEITIEYGCVCESPLGEEPDQGAGAVRIRVVAIDRKTRR